MALNHANFFDDLRRVFTRGLAGAYVPGIEKWRSEGYCFQLYYFWLPSADLAVQRVALRVKNGGHNIPEDTIRQRYSQSLKNLFRLYMPLADVWQVYDNERQGPARLVARGPGKEVHRVVDKRVWELIQQKGVS